jgi:hypothetical protein
MSNENIDLCIGSGCGDGQPVQSLDLKGDTDFLGRENGGTTPTARKVFSQGGAPPRVTGIDVSNDAKGDFHLQTNATVMPDGSPGCIGFNC